MEIKTFSIDIGKKAFHVFGLGVEGHPQLRSTFRRDTLLKIFGNSPINLKIHIPFQHIVYFTELEVS